jgi:phosphatidylglycerophosphate synthase
MLFQKLKDRIVKRKDEGYNMPFYEEYIIRPLSYPITNLLLKTQITPNQVTVFSNLLIVVASYFYYTGYKHLAIFLILGYFVLDCVDGEIAREKGLKSEKGAIMEDKLPVIFLIGFYCLCLYVELGPFYSLLYLFSVHIINTLSFLKLTTGIVIGDKPDVSVVNRVTMFLRSIFSFIKSPIFFASAVFINIPILMMVIVCALSITAVYKFYLLWKL